MYKDKKVLAVVPARGGSKEVKLKNIRELSGNPLIVFTADTIKQLDYIDMAIVSTDHEEIARIADKSGLKIPFMRPTELSGDNVSDIEVLVHALTETEKKYGTKYDIILMLQPTCPLRAPEHVKMTIEKLVDENYDSVWTLSKTDSKHHPLKQFYLEEGCLDYYDQKGENISARQQLSDLYHCNGASYAFTRDCILVQGKRKGKRTGYVVIEEPLANIDTEFDFKKAEWLLLQKKYQ